MNKFYFLMVFFIFFFGKAQSYSFDFLAKYVSGEKAKQRDIVMYFNSDDFSYYLKILKTPYEFTGYLFDENLKKIHQFNIIEQKKNGQITFIFEYKDSGKLMSGPKQYKNYQFVFNEISKDSSELKIYKTAKAKNPDEIYLLKYKPANKNLFPIARVMLMHPFEGTSGLDINKNIMVEYAKYNCFKNRCECEFSLEEYKNVELNLVVPNT